jgi:hypothetical protein
MNLLEDIEFEYNYPTARNRKDGLKIFQYFLLAARKQNDDVFDHVIMQYILPILSTDEAMGEYLDRRKKYDGEPTEMGSPGGFTGPVDI